MIYGTQPSFSCFKVDVWIELMEEKKKENPSFAKQFLIALHDKGLITWSDERHKYLWKIEVLKSISNWVDHAQICTSKSNIKHVYRNYALEYLGGHSGKQAIKNMSTAFYEEKCLFQ